MNNETLISALIGLMLLVVGLVFLGAYFRTKPKTLDEILNKTSSKDDKETIDVDVILYGKDANKSRLYTFLAPLEKVGLELSGTENDRFATRKLLSMAGYRRKESLGLYTISKYLLGAIGILTYLFGVLEPGERMGLNGLAGSLMILFFCSFFLEIWVKMRAASRGGRLSSSLPDALDLMVICAEAGLPLGRIFKTVSKELVFSAPELAEEIGYTYAEFQLLSDRSKALLNLSERCGVDNVEAMVSTLIQAERYGTPLSQALRTISEESRKSLILDLEEKAGKLPAQLSVPLMAFILPPVIAMMGTPAMVRIIRLLGS
jgi:tight adherence protein C